MSRILQEYAKQKGRTSIILQITFGNLPPPNFHQTYCGRWVHDFKCEWNMLYKMIELHVNMFNCWFIDITVSVVVVHVVYEML